MRGARVLWYALAAVAALYPAAFLLVAGSRLAYPYHLEWMEGGSLDHVRWLLAGHGLYVRPSLDFVPYTYPPLYYYAAAALAAVLGDGFLPLRLLSLLASLGCMAVIYLLVRREAADRPAALLAACLFAATFDISGAWFDLGRVDSLFLLLLLGSVLALRHGRFRGAGAVAGVLLALSYFAKQSALMVAAPLLVWAVLALRRRALGFAGAFVAVAGLGTLLLEWLSGGWYSFYVFALPAGHSYWNTSLWLFFRRDLIPPLGVALLLALVFLARRAGSRERRGDLWFYGALCLGLLAASYLSRIKVGAFSNVLMPAYAGLAVLFGLALADLQQLAAERSRPAARRGLEAALALACLGQLALLVYDPRAQIPPQEDRETGDELVQIIRDEPGEVFVPELGYLAGYAGKKVFAHSQSLFDVTRGHDRRLAAELMAEMKQAVTTRRVAAVFGATEDWGNDDWLGQELADWDLQEITYPGERTFYPLIGYPVRPWLLWEAP